MRMTITVANREEGNLIAAGLADPEVFALVKAIGALAALEDKGRGRALRWILDKLADKPVPASVELRGNGGGAEPVERLL